MYVFEEHQGSVKGHFHFFFGGPLTKFLVCLFVCLALKRNPKKEKKNLVSTFKLFVNELGFFFFFFFFFWLFVGLVGLIFPWYSWKKVIGREKVGEGIEPINSAGLFCLILIEFSNDS